MHILNKILVKLKNCTENPKAYSRNELVQAIRNYAEEKTEHFYQEAFDWRETSTAGSWQSLYPENVLFGSEDSEKLIREIKECQADADANIARYLQHLTTIDNVGDNLSKLVSYLLKDPETKEKSVVKEHDAYIFFALSRFLYGEYSHDSLFYDTEAYTAKIDSNTFRKITQAPDEWALVFFDHHF